MGSLNETKEKPEIKYLAGEINKENFEAIFNKIVSLFSLKEDETRVICHAKSEVSEVSLVKLANLCDCSVQFDYMTKRVEFCYLVKVITDTKSEIAEAVNETSPFAGGSDPDDLPF